MKPFASALLRSVAAISFSLVFLGNARADLVHSYQFNNSFADEFGGPALVTNGSAGAGTLGASNYSFAANQGLSLSSALASNATYSIVIDFAFATVSGYRKIVDFKDRSADAGLYNLSNALVFYPTSNSGPAGTFQADTFYRLVITRDNADDTFSAFVNGLLQFSFADTSDLAFFTGTNGIINFFNDDFTNGGEASGGTADQIAIYDTALTAAEVLALGGPGNALVPEPGSLALVAASGLAGLIALVRRRRSHGAR